MGSTRGEAKWIVNNNNNNNDNNNNIVIIIIIIGPDNRGSTVLLLLLLFFDIRVCHPNADSYRDLSPKQIYRIHENEKKRKYNSRVTEIEQGIFIPLVFTTTGEMADKCLRLPLKISRAIIRKKA